MFCHKCGASLSGGAGFCRKCGTKVTGNEVAQQPETEYDLPEKVINSQPLLSAAVPRSDISAEEVLFKAGGGQALGRTNSGGIIRLTNKRFIHESLRGKMQLEIDIHDIIGYQSAYLATYNYLGLVLFLPLVFTKQTIDNAIIIHTRQGLSYKFIVGNAKREQLFCCLETLIPAAQQYPKRWLIIPDVSSLVR